MPFFPQQAVGVEIYNVSNSCLAVSEMVDRLRLRYGMHEGLLELSNDGGKHKRILT